jgi:hypothetical protein
MTTLTALTRYHRSMTEAQMEDAIRDLVGTRGRVYHLRDARNAPELADLPDLLIFAPPVIALVELKSQRRKVAPGQAEVIGLLSRCDELIAGIVRPEPREDEWSYDDLLALLRDRIAG